MPEFWLYLLKAVPHLAFRLVCAVLALATFVPFSKPLPSTGILNFPNLNPTDPLTPLEQLSDWANVVGASELGAWLGNTATAAYAPGSAVWSTVATAALFFTGLVLVMSRFNDGISNLSAPLTFLAIAAIGQAGSNPIWPFIWWFVLTSLFSLLSPFSKSRGDTHVEAAMTPLVAIFCVFAYPIMLFINLASFTAPSKSQNPQS